MTPSTSFFHSDPMGTAREGTTRWVDLPGESTDMPITLSSPSTPPREVTLAAGRAAREARIAAREAVRREQARTRAVVLAIWSVAVLLAGTFAFVALVT